MGVFRLGLLSSCGEPCLHLPILNSQSSSFYDCFCFLEALDCWHCMITSVLDLSPTSERNFPAYLPLPFTPTFFQSGGLVGLYPPPVDDHDFSNPWPYFTRDLCTSLFPSLYTQSKISSCPTSIPPSPPLFFSSLFSSPFSLNCPLHSQRSAIIHVQTYSGLYIAYFWSCLSIKRPQLLSLSKCTPSTSKALKHTAIE